MDNTRNVPLFILCYSEFCGHCHGLPNAFREFSKMHSGDDILVTMIDCDKDKKGCSFFHVEGTPKMALVVGSDHRYWFRTKKRTPNEWENWINDITTPYVVVQNDEDVLNLAKESMGNSSIFYLEMPSNYPKQKEYLEKFRFINRYNAVLALKINDFLSKPLLKVYQSEFCYREFTGENLNELEVFIYENKFGIMHNYYVDELEELVKKKNALIYVSEKHLNEYRNESFRNVVKNYCTPDYTFGWTSVLEKQQILKVLNYSLIDVPFFFGINQKTNRSDIYKLKMEDQKLKQFIEHLETPNTGFNLNVHFVFICILIPIINLIIVSILPFSEKPVLKIE